MTALAPAAVPAPAEVARLVTPPRGLLGRVAVEDAERRSRGCERPIRLVGGTKTHTIHPTTGELGPVIASYSSADELDGYTYVRCGDRRAHRCASCSREYKGDAWHLLMAGLAGDDAKGVPVEVASHPLVFATFTAPSFGPVHGRRHHNPCRARRDRPACPHGRPLYCLARHSDDDARLGEPLCLDCYDYIGHVLWQWHLPELWRRFRIRLERVIAAHAGIPHRRFRDHARLAYSKVGEFQARGLIHFHALMRLDGPDGPTSDPTFGLDAVGFAELVRQAATEATYTVPDPLTPGEARELVWGAQLDVEPVTDPNKLAGYLAKYLTKSTEEFGLDGRVHSADGALQQGAGEHVVRIIATAEALADAADRAGDEDMAKLAARYATLGYRGHPITKTRRYSTTFAALRAARAAHRARRPAGQPGDAYTVREALREADADDPAPLVTFRAWTFAGVGYLAPDAAERALLSATNAREYATEHCSPMAHP